MPAAEKAEAADWLARADGKLAARDLVCAAAALDRAEAHGADPNRCDGSRWLVAMLAGDFERAWRLSDAIRARGLPDPHRFWNGEDLRGARVIVRCLHGLGDAVQMLGYAPRLAAIAASVVWEVPPRMLELAPYFEGVGQAITWGDEAPPRSPAYDAQAEVMELPYLFRTQSSELPIAARYLHVPASLIAGTAARMGPCGLARAGVVWTAGEWNPERSLPLDCLGPLLAHPAYEFWNLQGGAARHELPLLRDATRACGEGLLALAAAIANLDLVITVDTLAAHLAGALGKPVFLLLQHAADWRWQAGRDDSPWYPTMRIFRQPVAGDWRGAVSQVCQALSAGDAQ